MPDICKDILNCNFIKSFFNNNGYTVLVEKCGKIIYYDDNFKKFFENNQVIEKKLSELINPSAYEEIRKMMLEVIFTSKQREKILNVFNDKEYYRITIVPIINNESQVHYLLLKGSNVTHSKKLEKENEELKKKLEEANSIKSIFLSNISHELRTPMNAIIGFSDLLLNENDFKKNRFLKSMNSNAKHLDELLNNILDYAKIESNEFELLYENFSINDLFDELSDIFEDVNYKKNLDFVKMKFIKNEDKKIVCDYMRLKQVLFNVISNSIKFTDKGYINISYQESDSSIIFKIEDSGIGIPKDKIQFVFDRFWQCDSTSTKKYKGTGLGLSISKSIVEMFNGQIWVESTLGKGSTFFIKIPLEEIKSEDIIIKSKDDINFSGKTILLVDELPINYSLISIYLNSLGIKMINSYNGKEAIEIFKQQKEKIHLIILDINLSDMNGFELAKKLKKIDANYKIICKAGVEMEKGEYVDYFLKKPFKKEKLIEILKDVWQK